VDVELENGSSSDECDGSTTTSPLQPVVDNTLKEGYCTKQGAFVSTPHLLFIHGVFCRWLPQALKCPGNH